MNKSSTMQKPILLLTLGLSLAGPALHAQMAGANLQADSMQQRRQLTETALALRDTNSVPSLFDGETDDVGPQSVLLARARRIHWEAFADAQYFHTDNAFLTDHNRQGADVLVSTAQAALSLGPVKVADGALTPRLGYQQQWFNYDLIGSGRVTVIDPATFSTKDVKLNTFDFSAGTAFGDLAWRCENWVVGAGADFRRLLDSGNYREFYREYVPRWSLRRDFLLCPNVGISLGYEGDYRFTETTVTPNPGYPDNYNDRNDHSLVLVGSWQVCRNAILQPYYRLQYSHYTQTHRDDVLNSVGLALNCPLGENVTLRAFAGYDTLHTDGYLAKKYGKLDLGGGLNLTVRF